MSDQEETAKPEKTKRVWFVTKFPGLTITKKPQDFYLHKGREVQQKAERLLFSSEVMPRRLRGQGMLGSGNQAGDRNENAFWGVFSTDSVEVIEFLRGHEYYRTTPQDNKIHAGMKLKELNWDPTVLDKAEGVGVKGHFEPQGKPEEPAPTDAAPARPTARVGLTKAK